MNTESSRSARPASMTAALARTKAMVLATFADPDEDRWEGNELDLFDQVITIAQARKIPPSDVAVVQHSLVVIH